MIELRPHQKKALSRLKNGSILTGGVGTGKSLVAAMYYATTQDSRAVYVITTAKKRDSLDWDREFARLGIGRTLDATTAGLLQVDSWNNIHKYVGTEQAFFIFDEQRLVGSGGWVRAFLKIVKNNNWILLSATPGDSWFDYIPVFIANGFYKNKTEFVAKHVIYRTYLKFPVVDRYVDEGKLLKLRASITVDMPYEKHTTRHTIKIAVDHDETLMKRVMKDRWNPFTDEPLRNAAEMVLAMRRVANSHPSRFEALKKVLKKHPRLIIFYNFNYELEILKTLEGVKIAEWNGHRHEEIPDDDAWIYLVQFTAGAEGWECIQTNAVFFWSQNYSYKLFEQAYGRIDRLNTPFTDLYYYLPMSRSWIDAAIRRAILGKRDFNLTDMSKFFDEKST